MLLLLLVYYPKIEVKLINKLFILCECLFLGISWSIGGDYTYSKIVSLPNILQKYNPKLEGFSTQVSVIFPNDQNATHNRLNVGQ